MAEGTKMGTLDLEPKRIRVKYRWYKILEGDILVSLRQVNTTYTYVHSHCFELSLILTLTHPSANQLDSDCRSSALLQTCSPCGYLVRVKALIQKEMGSTVSSFHIFQFSKQTKCSCVPQVLGETGISQAQALLRNLYCLMNHCWLSKLWYLSSVLPSHPHWLKFWWLSTGYMTQSDSNPKPFETVLRLIY